MKFYDIIITEEGMSVIDNDTIIKTFPFVKGSFIDICNNNINFWSKDLFKTNKQYHTWINYNNSLKKALYLDLNCVKNTNIMHELIQGTNRPRYFSPKFDYSNLNTNYLTIVNTTVIINNKEYMTSIIKEFSKNGEILFEWSILDYLLNLNLNLSQMEVERDLNNFIINQTNFIACNGVCKIPKNNLNDKRFQEGNYLVSERTLGIIFVVDKDTKEIVWKIEGKDLNYHSSHYAHMIPEGLEGEGNILFYNNDNIKSPVSSIIELNPLTKEIIFKYESKEIKSAFKGSVQKTIDNTYLICPSEQGRIIEVDKYKNIVKNVFIADEEFLKEIDYSKWDFNNININVLNFFRAERIPYSWIIKIIEKYPFLEKEHKFNFEIKSNYINNTNINNNIKY